MDLPVELVKAIVGKVYDQGTLAILARASQTFQIIAEKKLYHSLCIDHAHELFLKSYELLRALAASSRRASYVKFFILEFGRFRDWEVDGFSDEDEDEFEDGGYYEGCCDDDEGSGVSDVDEEEVPIRQAGKKSGKGDDTDEADVDPRFKSWDAKDLALDALEKMESLTDLRLKIRKAPAAIIQRLNDVIGQAPFRLQTFFCDGHLKVQTLVKAHRATLQVVIVWMWPKGYDSTVNLIPEMIPSTNPTYVYSSLIVAGFEPTESPFTSETAMMLFPQYLPIYSSEHGAYLRTVNDALETFQTIFSRDTRHRERLSLQKQSTVICCVESLAKAKLNLRFTRALLKHCRFGVA